MVAAFKLLPPGVYLVQLGNEDMGHAEPERVGVCASVECTPHILDASSTEAAGFGGWRKSNARRPKWVAVHLSQAISDGVKSTYMSPACGRCMCTILVPGRGSTDGVQT